LQTPRSARKGDTLPDMKRIANHTLPVGRVLENSSAYRNSQRHQPGKAGELRKEITG
jgi:hypothetical protein